MSLPSYGENIRTSLSFLLGSVQFSHSVVSDSLQPMDCSTPGFPVHHQLLEPAQTHVHLVGDAIQPSYPIILFSSCLQSYPASGSFTVSQFFASGGEIIEASASASVPPMNIHDWVSLDWLVGSPCSPRDSQQSSPTPQFKSINSLVLSLLHSPPLTSIHDYWKNHSFYCIDIGFLTSFFSSRIALRLQHYSFVMSP